MTFKHLGALDALYLGVGGATGDSSNPLSVRGSGSLFDGNTGGHQVRVNKGAVGNDASFSFETASVAKVVLGLLGSDDFTIKVGASSTTALTIAEATGMVSFPAGIKQIQVGATPPSSPAVGDLWVDTN